MSMVMFVIGCIAVMAGVAMAGFGIPISEFSFGNTLIVSGTTLATGGLIIVALSVVARQLARLAEVQGMRIPAAPPRPAPESFEPPPEARPAPARPAFPAKPAMRELREPPPAEPPMPDFDAQERLPSFAPSLRNPEAPPMTVEDEVSLSPPPSPTNGSGPGGSHEHEPPPLETWHPEPPPREAPTSYFDSMWPAKPKMSPPAGPPRTPKPDLPPRERESIARAPSPPSEPRPPQPSRTNAAILKSGVVDGMAYTLYVDGSIEAELPQGTLRFASIDELRSHLEKNS